MKCRPAGSHSGRQAFACTTLALVLASLMACGRGGNGNEQQPTSPQPPAIVPGATPPAPSSWTGQWNGPEGTYLKLAAKEGHDGEFTVAIRNLDGERQFDGRAAGDHIEFERDGASETLRASNGQATGMKWLADRKDCLTIKSGEGYCRD